MNKKGIVIGLALAVLILVALPFHFPFEKIVALVVGFGLRHFLSKVE